MKRFETIIDYFARSRVSFGFFVGIGTLLFLRPCNTIFLSVGLAVSFFGLLIRSWAAGHIRKSKELATEGPYSLIRHPLYLGSLLMAGGFGVAVTCPDKLALSTVFWILLGLYFAACYSATIVKEERALKDKFGAGWSDYQKEVPALIPFRLRIGGLIGHAFSLKQYLRNREYQAVVGWVGAAALLFMVLPHQKNQEGLIDIRRAALTASAQKSALTSVKSPVSLSPSTVAATKTTVSAINPPTENSEGSLNGHLEPEERLASAEKKEEQTARAVSNEEDDSFETKRDPSLLNPLFAMAFAGTSALALLDDQAQSGIQKVFNQRSGQQAAEHGRPAGKLGELSSGLGIAGSFYAAGLFSNSPKARRIGIVGAQALVLNSLLAEGLAHSFGRSSPANGDADDFDPMGTGESFPSKHTAAAFTLASVVAEESDSLWIDSLSYGLAGAVGLSRLSDDQHWVSDVTVSALIGIAVGKTVSRLEKRKGWSKRLYSNGRGLTYQQKF